MQTLATATTNFEVQKEIEGSTFEADKTNNINKISWLGKVNANTAAVLLQLGGDSVEFNGFTKLVIDRSQLTEFDTEARIWIKDFLKTRARKLARNVEKLAIINAQSSIGSIFSNMMASAIGLIIPSMTMKKFDDVKEAEAWLLA